MNMFFGLIFSLFFIFMALVAQPQFPENGNIITEPTLADYSHGNRTPGILDQAEGVIDANGNPTDL